MRNVRTLLLIALLSFAADGAFADPISLLDPASVVASQGGVAVTLADVDRLADTIPAADRAQVFNSPRRIERALSGLLLQKQLAAQARVHGLDKNLDGATMTPYEIERRLAAAEQRHFIENLQVPDMDQLAHENYIVNRSAYVMPTPLVVERILISTAQRSDADARATAHQVELESRKDPHGFEALVDTYSDAPDKAATKGRIEVTTSQDPALIKAAAALKAPGDISSVTKTDGGFSILKLIERGPDKAQSFEIVSAQITTSLKRKWIKDKGQLHIDELRNQVLDANPDLVAALRTRYAGAADAQTVPTLGGGR